MDLRAPKGASTGLRERFAHEYLKDKNATRAYVRAGGTSRYPGSCGSEMLNYPGMREYIAGIAEERAALAKVDAVTVLRELMAVATVDLAAAFDEQGNVLPLEDIPFEVRKAIAGIDVEEIWAGRGEGRKQVGVLRKLKFYDRTKALEMLGRHLSLFTDKLALQNPDGTPLALDDGAKAARLAAILEGAARRQQGEDTGEQYL